MLIDKNIKNILGGGYNVSEVKYMDKTVWSEGKNIDLDVNVEDGIHLIIDQEEYKTGTYSYKLANDEELKILASGKVPGKKIELEDEEAYYNIKSINILVTSIDNPYTGLGRSDENSENVYNEDKYLTETNVIPYECIKNGDKLTINAGISYYLKKL